MRTHRYPYEHFKCDRCPRAFSWRPGLLRHQTIKHGAIKKYPCENCNKIFTDPSNLQRHIRTHHVGARSHACAECGKTFATSSGLKQHTHIHSSVKPFQCEVCLKVMKVKPFFFVFFLFFLFQMRKFLLFQAYTQFSNLCRHRRMHADCRLQIKCGKCGQSFSSVTSQTKHKRFCDSTSSPATGTTATPMSQPSTNIQGANPSNPLFMYPRHLPFYPTSLLSPYPSLCGLSNSTSVTTPFISNSLFFSPSQPRVSSHRKRSYSNENDRSASPVDRKRRLINNVHHHEKELQTPPPPPPSSSILKSKISPAPAEEAVSVEKPSPARPQVSAVTSIFSNPREVLSPDKKNSKVKEEESNSVKSSGEFTSTSSSKSGGGSSSTVDKEQPLDLRVSRKRIVYSTEEEKTIDNKSASSKTLSPTSNTTPTTQESKTPDVLESKLKLNVPPPSTPESSATTTTTSLSTTLGTNSTPPTMAYPRPIHPMLLEAMYRPSAGFPQSFPPHSERLLGPPPPPPPPFGPPRTFPFLGSLMNGLPNGQSNQRSLDLLRNPLPGFTGVKPYQDVLSSQLRNGGSTKMKDRYGCTFCGKIFPRSANLTRHVRTHTGEQPYKCQYCERPFSISSNLQRHVRNIHNKEKPFKCPSCERCFGQQTNLDRHLKKHEADDGTGNSHVADSPESNESEREDACFDEIRMFMGKVTYSGDTPSHMYSNYPYMSPKLSQDMNVAVVKDDKDSETLSDERSTTPTIFSDDRQTLSPKDYSLPLTYDVKVKAEQEAINNNTPDQEPIEVVT